MSRKKLRAIVKLFGVGEKIEWKKVVRDREPPID